jgi:hypothetical protein
MNGDSEADGATISAGRDFAGKRSISHHQVDSSVKWRHSY